jgi:hypothetical protein
MRLVIKKIIQMASKKKRLNKASRSTAVHHIMVLVNDICNFFEKQPQNPLVHRVVKRVAYKIFTIFQKKFVRQNNLSYLCPV